MPLFDASSMIYAWDNYPIRQFPGLWEWMSAQIKANRLAMPSVAFEEVENKTPECAVWLRDNGIEQVEINNAVLNEAMRIKKLIGIVDDKYHSKGVGENDLFIIAVARIHGAELISDEERQTIHPKEPTKRKIPAVCSLKDVSVLCINFLDFIKRSDAIFR
jgi:predicted nucleic acid-binding protein